MALLGRGWRVRFAESAETLLTLLGVPSSGIAFERITVDPAQMGGVPCIRGMRVTVSWVLGQLAAGRAVDQLLEDYPYLEPDDVTAVLEFAAAIVNEREVPMARLA